jgi:hypothetical protein
MTAANQSRKQEGNMLMTPFPFDPEIVPDADRVLERYRA